MKETTLTSLHRTEFSSAVKCLLSLLLCILLFFLAGCGDKGSDTETLYKAKELKLPESLNRIEEMYFDGNDIYVGGVREQNARSVTAVVLKSRDSGSSWTRILKKTYTCPDVRNFLSLDVNFSMSSSGIAVMSAIETGRSVKDVRVEVRSGELFDYRGKRLTTLKLPPQMNIAHVVMDSEYSGYGTLDIDDDECLAKILHFNGQTGKYKIVADNEYDYDFQLAGGRIYVEGKCLDTRNYKTLTAPDSVKAVWKDEKEYFSDQKKLADGSKYLWRVVQTPEKETLCFALTREGIYRFAGDTRTQVGESPSKTLGENKYTFDRFFARDSDEFFVPYNDDTFWNGLRLIQYRQEKSR